MEEKKQRVRVELHTLHTPQQSTLVAINDNFQKKNISRKDRFEAVGGKAPPIRLQTIKSTPVLLLQAVQGR